MNDLKSEFVLVIMSLWVSVLWYLMSQISSNWDFILWLKWPLRENFCQSRKQNSLFSRKNSVFPKRNFRATVAKKITFWFIRNSVLPTLTQNLNFQILRETKLSHFYRHEMLFWQISGPVFWFCKIQSPYMFSKMSEIIYSGNF